MFPTAACLRFQSRRPLLSFRANKDYYKGNRQAALPGHRTGAPGVHINKRPGYELRESRVRVFVAPPIQEILDSPLKPYVAQRARVPRSRRDGVFHGMPDGGLTPEHFLAAARKYHLANFEAARERDRLRSVTAAETVSTPATPAA
ncbi:hypothetical protein GGX14DRAFT_424227 [Mycena pura]|uniref:Uncharacterized protein n=1 Tax=Mycena pura TaxID=153505 RepID=A0AAD6YMQ6_9AGAR|nr:hypothetical protein GGX14DRAFT_424227 [Mycena pura]